MTAILEISPGTFIGDRYRIETLLGQGGFGRTYLVSDWQCLGALCVLKEFFPITKEENALKKALELFQREAKVLQKLDHPQIPQFLNWFEDRGRLFIIQEYIDGKTYWELLKERLEQGQVFSEAEILQWLKDLLPVLDYLHGCHIIHRDISPDNIMLSKQRGKPILIDLGIVKEAVTQGYYSYISHNGTLGAASLVGKRGFSPPEQMLMGQCYPSSDLYSLAVTALVLLTRISPTELFDSHSMEWQWQNYVKLSDNLGQIFSKMLAEKPKDRYRSAKEVLAALSASVSNSNFTSISLTQEEPTALFLSELGSEEELNPPPQDKIFHEENNAIVSRSRKSLKTGGIMAAGVLLSSLIVGLQSPFIPVLCKRLDNCVRDKEYQTIYQRQVEQGKEAIVKATQAQSIEDLKNARDRLNQTLTQLKTIPNDVKISPQAQQILKDYQTRFEQINTRVVKGEQAEQQLKQAETLISQATKTTEAAKTIEQYQQAKAQWEKIQQQLKAIPSDIVVDEKVKTQIAKSRDEATEIQTQIERHAQEAKAAQKPIISKSKNTSSRSSGTIRKTTSGSLTRKQRSTSDSSREKASRVSKSQQNSHKVYNRNTYQNSRISVRSSSPRTPLWQKNSARSSGKKPLW
jgi:serine/threonine-protein kinase